jgi:translation initiation factor 5B
MSQKNKKVNPIAKLAQERIKLINKEEIRIKALQDEEDRKIREEEEKEKARIEAIENEKQKKRKIKENKINSQKEAGTYKTKSQKENDKKLKLKLEAFKKSGILNDDGTIVLTNSKLNSEIIEKSVQEIEIKNLRSIIISVLGHVDAGKTVLLDTIRNTDVQNSEAGGITQQIGASFIPKYTLINKTKISNIKIPGLLMIDTPGHEAFTNLRKRGSSLCDIAIVVIDLTNGLQQQTIQSINMLVESKIKFVFALNKIDRLYGWKTIENVNIRELLDINKQSSDINNLYIDEFRNKLFDITTQIMSIGLNAKLFWENDSLEDTISIIPISAKTSEGINDLLELIINLSQDQVLFSDKLECTIIEKTIDKTIGSSIDVILKNGFLNKGETISFQTNEGFETTIIKNLLTPPPNKESRVKFEYIHNNSVKGSIGVKIVADNIDKAIVGTQIIYPSELDKISDQVIVSKLKLDDDGVSVFTSSQGSLEAFVNFLQNECKPNVPVHNISIGSVTKKFINKMILNKSDKKEFATILAFNVNIEDGVQELADKNDIKIFTSEIIYQLFDIYQNYRIEMINQRKDLYRSEAIFPCILKILEKNIYYKKHPLVFGVLVQEGNLRIGTPLICDNKVYIGKVTNIKSNDSDINIAKCGIEVCIKVENEQNQNIMYGRHFDFKNNIYSLISRTSIDVLRTHFRDEATSDDAKLIVKLKKSLSIN